MRDTDDGNLSDSRSSRDNALDLAWVDVEAAHEDEVSAPVDQPQVAIVVGNRDVASREIQLIGVRTFGNRQPVPLKRFNPRTMISPDRPSTSLPGSSISSGFHAGKAGWPTLPGLRHP